MLDRCQALEDLDRVARSRRAPFAVPALARARRERRALSSRGPAGRVGARSCDSTELPRRPRAEVRELLGAPSSDAVPSLRRTAFSYHAIARRGPASLQASREGLGDRPCCAPVPAEAVLPGDGSSPLRLASRALELALHGERLQRVAPGRSRRSDARELLRRGAAAARRPVSGRKTPVGVAVALVRGPGVAADSSAPPSRASRDRVDEPTAAQQRAVEGRREGARRRRRRPPSRRR